MHRPAIPQALRRPAFRWLTAGLAIAVAAALAPINFASATTTDIAPAAQTGSQSLEQAVAGTLVSQHAAQANASFGKPANAAVETLVEPKRRAADGSWVFGGAVIRVPSDVQGGPVAVLFLAQRVDGQWRVALEGSPEFTAAAPTAPVLNTAERRLFGRPASQAANGTPTGLALPWSLNAAWAHWGVHGDSGTSLPYNSVDFYGGDGQVRASRAGTLYRFCTSGRWPFVKLVHDNGYSTGYYHISNQTTKGDGAAIAAYEFLGKIDVQLPCGGTANGNHVHWTLWKGSRAETVVGKTVGGWTWYQGSSAYQGYAERNGVKVYRNNCCPIVNYGPEDGTTPSPTPTSSPTVSPTATVSPTSTPGGCAGYQTTFTGSLSSGASAYHPNNSYYYSSVSGSHRACLDAPTGTDYDLYLQKWNGSAWSNVASGTTSAADETLTYSGSAGYYRYRVHAYSGSGGYTIAYNKP